MVLGKHNDISYFSKLKDIHEQVNVIGMSQYVDYKNGIFPSVEKTYLSPNAKYTLSPYEELIGIEDDGLITYELNSSGQRCENFKYNHEEGHILFAGCSYTSGEALPYKQNWSGKLYDKITGNTKKPGYYTVAYPGGGIDVIVNNIFQYCNMYGVPDTIFILFPEISRKFSWVNDRYYSLISPYEGEHSFDSHGGLENALYYSYNIIRNLEIFCNKLGVKLVWSTWREHDSMFFQTMNFENYLHITHEDIKNNIKNYKDVNHKYFNIGRDQAHPGLAYSDAISNIFLKEYNEKYVL